MEINYRALTSQAQTILNRITEDGRQMVYAINPDGSFMEIQPGCTLLSMARYQMEIYIGGKVNAP